MIRFNSILSRIIILHILAVATTALFMPFVLFWLLNSEVDSLQHKALQEQANSLTRHLAAGADGAWSLDLSPALRDQYSTAYDRFRYAILDDAGQVLFSSRNNGMAVFPADDRSSQIEYLEAHRGEHIISGGSFRKRFGTRIVWVQVGEDLAHRDVIIDDVVANFFHKVGWITLPILLLLLGADILIFRRALWPLLRASDQAQKISPAGLDIRLPAKDIPSEIRPLVTAVNQGLDRLQRGFSRQREFAAETAHELRTPLAILRTRIETLPDRNVINALQEDIEGMSRIVSQLLDAAELDVVASDSDETADLRDICAEVAESIVPLALKQEKTVTLGGAEHPIWIKGNAEMLRRAVRNLVENALDHTPTGTEVEINVSGEGAVSVKDHGAGIAPDERELIFERFWRRDRRRPGSAGLGLSIVKGIVSMHGGTITVANHEGGGAEFIMLFQPVSASKQSSPDF